MSLQPTSFGLLLLLAIFSFQCGSFPPATRTSSPTTTTPRGSSTSASQVRQNIANFAIDQEGTRYKYAGRSPQTGFDCSGFTYFVFDNFNVELTPVSRVQEGEGKRISVDDAQTGDLIFFRRSKGGSVFHVALVVKNEPNNLTVIHSTSSRGVIMENIYNSSYWRSKVTTARDILGR
ncbi:MAG: C40 family peptidase [Bacteroidota bacterium]